MHHQGLLARRKNYKNKLCKEDFLYFLCKTTNIITTSRYHSTDGRTTAGSTICTHMDVVYFMKKYKNASLYLHTWACQINQTSLLEHIWFLWLLLNHGIIHGVCLVASQSLSLKNSTCEIKSPPHHIWWGCPKRWENCPDPAQQPGACHALKALQPKAIC